MSDKKTAIVTGASQGIGTGLVEAFLREGYNVIATSRDVSQSFRASSNQVLVDGDMGKQETAAKAVEPAIKHFGTIDVLVNNAGIYRTEPFTDFTSEDFNALVSTNLLGFFFITPLAVATDAETEIWKRCDHVCVARPISQLPAYCCGRVSAHT
jgi:NAD(P)-dependent dehydrogenase (short-subunit alcohol dehydrogenase family)